MILIARTYITYKNKMYLVSTINRECSSLEGYGSLYSETLVWEWEPSVQNTVGSPLHQDTGSENSLFSHLRALEFIYKGGLE